MIALCLPYYRNPTMLVRQADAWAGYPRDIQVIVVDDGSPEPADDVLPRDSRAALYRIGVDVQWNRNGARNLAAHVAEAEWLLQTDIDHVLDPTDAAVLAAKTLDPGRWYRFRRYRVGAADETRRKDALDPDCSYGEVKPHVDSYLCRRSLYWSAGGYDEDFSGSIGGSAPFLSHLAAAAPCEVMRDVALRVHTRHSVPDANDTTLDRDQTRFRRLREQKRAAGDPKPTEWLRFPWHRVR